MEKIERNTHHGHAVQRIRKTLKIKQEAVATELGVNQARISEIEQKRVIDDETLEKLAKIYKVPVEYIKNLEEDPVTLVIENNTFENGSIGNIAAHNDNEDFGNTYNDIDKILELSNEKAALYGRMLELEKEKTALLEKLLNERK
ncbi:MAG: helix-turn-helix transcriptional regulator [Dysgonomonas sp.]|nr:helix-turn-helix transcriptional regulator [Dysgonomonas sp.]